MEIQKEGKIGRVLKPLKKELWGVDEPDIDNYYMIRELFISYFEESLRDGPAITKLGATFWEEEQDEYALSDRNLYRLVFYLTASLWLFDEEVMNADDKSGYFLNVAYYDIKSYYEEKMWEVIPEGYNCRELLEKDIKRFFEYLDENPDIRDASI